MICYLDDDVDHDLLIRLAAARPHRLVSPRTLGRSGDHDAVHFLYAVSQRIPLMTRNARDFAALHELVLGAGGHHFGLLVVYEEADRKKNMRAGDIINALSNLESANVRDGLEQVSGPFRELLAKRRLEGTRSTTPGYAGGQAGIA